MVGTAPAPPAVCLAGFLLRTVSSAAPTRFAAPLLRIGIPSLAIGLQRNSHDFTPTPGGDAALGHQHGAVVG